MTKKHPQKVPKIHRNIKITKMPAENGIQKSLKRHKY